MNPFFIALTFLTIIPVPGLKHIDENLLSKSSSYFPAVGAIIGGVLLLFCKLLHCLFPFRPSITAALLLVLWVLITGALHLDGLADTFDGVAGGITIEDRLRIMKDTHIGTFGVVAVILLLILKYNLLLNLEGLKLTAALFFSPILARWGLVVLMSTSPYAGKKESMGKLFMEKITPAYLAVATASILAASVLSPRLFFLFLLPLTLLSIVALRAFFLKKLGGITGDCLGAACELIELVLLFILSLPF
jgi:adenosylcobinamide-GDP ribazoletransferase